jgi:hypothetical protein
MPPHPHVQVPRSRRALGKLTKSLSSPLLHQSTTGSSPASLSDPLLGEQVADAVSSSILFCGSLIIYSSSHRTHPKAFSTTPSSVMCRNTLRRRRTLLSRRHLVSGSHCPIHLTWRVCLVLVKLTWSTFSPWSPPSWAGPMASGSHQCRDA